MSLFCVLPPNGVQVIAFFGFVESVYTVATGAEISHADKLMHRIAESATQPQSFYEYSAVLHGYFHLNAVLKAEFFDIFGRERDFSTFFNTCNHREPLPADCGVMILTFCRKASAASTFSLKRDKSSCSKYMV